MHYSNLALMQDNTKHIKYGERESEQRERKRESEIKRARERES